MWNAAALENLKQTIYCNKRPGSNKRPTRFENKTHDHVHYMIIKKTV